MTSRQSNTSRRHFADLPAPQQAGILCADPRFQRYAAERAGMFGVTFTEGACAEFIRRECGIESRRELATNTRAERQFQALRASFEVWTGQQAAPRHR